MNRNDRMQGRHPLKTLYLVGRGRPIPGRVTLVSPNRAQVFFKADETGTGEWVPTDHVAREPRRFNRNSPWRRARRAVSQLLLRPVYGGR